MAERVYALDSLEELELRHVQGEIVTYKGRRALRLIEVEQDVYEHSLAILSDSVFKDGIIDAWVAGAPRSDAPADMRGFVGLAFRIQPHVEAFECIFVRPTNGRADDQVRRNHSTQYISHPDYPWYRLREEAPGMYESYTDLIPGEWIHLRIEVSGRRALLYVNDAEQPCLIVNDLKHGENEGQVGLWIGTGSEAHFSLLRVTSGRPTA